MTPGSSEDRGNDDEGDDSDDKGGGNEGLESGVKPVAERGRGVMVY